MGRRFLFILLVASACSLGWGASGEPARTIPEMRLANGTVLRDVRIMAAGSTTVMAMWEGGKGTILISQLPEEVRSAVKHQQEAKAAARPSTENLSASDLELGANGLPFRIKLTNGFVMRECVILRWSQDFLTVRYLAGTVPVRYADIDPAQRALFESKRSAVIAQQIQDAADKARRESQSQIATESRTREEQEKAIQNGLALQHLVSGMSMDDVRAVYGAPSSRSESYEGSTQIVQWTYQKQKDSHLPNGTLQDNHVQFFDGKLKTWDGVITIPEMPRVESEPVVAQDEGKRPPQLEEEIQKAIKARRPMGGMTMEEARTALGTPTTVSTTKRGPVDFALWTYERNATRPRDLHLEFFDGILGSWSG